MNVVKARDININTRSQKLIFTSLDLCIWYFLRCLIHLLILIHLKLIANSLFRNKRINFLVRDHLCHGHIHKVACLIHLIRSLLPWFGRTLSVHLLRLLLFGFDDKIIFLGVGLVCIWIDGNIDILENILHILNMNLRLLMCLQTCSKLRHHWILMMHVWLIVELVLWDITIVLWEVCVWIGVTEDWLGVLMLHSWWVMIHWLRLVS